ncbi:MAG: hypothetical protein AABX47_03855 [Nanoarchaeota archaeon]
MENKTTNKTIAYALRGIYLAILAICFATGKPQHLLAFSGPFIVTIPILFLAKEDDGYYSVDASFISLFTIAMLMSYFELWPAAASPTSIDKLFHIAAGACLANFARVFLKKKVNDKWTYYALIIAVTLAVGGAWEVYEWTGSKLPAAYMTPSTGYDDTMMDIIADIIGALIVAGYAWFRAWKKKEQTWVEIK